jgi:uncharacterized membrane-anchored protein YitT (DUF2179 family)
LTELHREVISFPAAVKYMEKAEEILFCVFSKKEVRFVKSIINNIDKNAFFLVVDIRDVLGKGFSEK